MKDYYPAEMIKLQIVKSTQKMVILKQKQDYDIKSTWFSYNKFKQNIFNLIFKLFRRQF